MTYTGLPIMVSLANTAVSFSCRINYQNTPGYKDFTVSFFHVDLHDKRSLEKPITCQHSPGAENHTMDCTVELSLMDVSDSGTYYCLVKGPLGVQQQGDGVLILVRGKASSFSFANKPEATPPPQTLALLVCQAPTYLSWCRKRGAQYVDLPLAALDKRLERGHSAHWCQSPTGSVGQ